MTHARRPDWPERLSAFVGGNMDRAYAYGHWDCIMLCAGAAKAITGKDYARGHRGKYKSAASSIRYLRSLGHASPEAMIDSFFEVKPVGFAQRGDLVLCRTDSGDNPGVCMGDFVLLAAEEGVIRAPRELWLKAWAVGEQHADWETPRKRKRKAAP